MHDPRQRDDIAEMLAHYADDREHERLSRGMGRLEAARLVTLGGSVLPERPVRILDVGGGTGALVRMLVRPGDEVHLLDRVPLHLLRSKRSQDSGASALRSAICGDARQLPFAAGTMDLCMMFGPLYHLQREQDRHRCLTEAARVLKPGGRLLGVVISRWITTFDGMVQGRLNLPGYLRLTLAHLSQGRAPDEGVLRGWLSMIQTHTPGQIRAEAEQAGFSEVTLRAVEGPAWLNPDLDSVLDDDLARAALLAVLERVHAESVAIEASAHIFFSAVLEPSAPSLHGELRCPDDLRR